MCRPITNKFTLAWLSREASLATLVHVLKLLSAHSWRQLHLLPCGLPLAGPRTKAGQGPCHNTCFHVGLDELEGLLLDHASGLSLEHSVELIDHVEADTLSLLAGLVERVLHVVESLNTLAYTQAKVAKPLVVERDGPVQAQEIDCVQDDAIVVARG